MPKWIRLLPLNRKDEDKWADDSQSSIGGKCLVLHAAEPSACTRVLALSISVATSLEYPDEIDAQLSNSFIPCGNVPVTQYGPRTFGEGGLRRRRRGGTLRRSPPLRGA